MFTLHNSILFQFIKIILQIFNYESGENNISFQ